MESNYYDASGQNLTSFLCKFLHNIFASSADAIQTVYDLFRNQPIKTSMSIVWPFWHQYLFPLTFLAENQL